MKFESHLNSNYSRDISSLSGDTLFRPLRPFGLPGPRAVNCRVMQSFQFHPVVARWFEEKFGSPTEPQQRGWPAIQSGAHTLIAAPTGSGKTLAAFFAALDQLFRDGLAAKLKDETLVVYVSPLKALSNDIHKNLEEPLAGIRAALKQNEG